MQTSDYTDLLARIAEIGLSAPLERVLGTIALYLAHAHGLDPVAEAEALAAKSAEEAAPPEPAITVESAPAQEGA
jgi:hypothetical protein